MRARERWGAWVIVAAMAMAAGACSGDGSGAGPRDPEIVDTLAAFWDGVGVPRDKTVLYGYDYQTHRSTRSCQHLAEDDRWYAQRTSEIVTDDVLPQAELHQAAIAYLEGNGYRVDRWKTSAPDAPVALGLVAHKGETAIKVDISSNGVTLLKVRMGPCATPTLDAFTEPLYERVP